MWRRGEEGCCTAGRHIQRRMEALHHKFISFGMGEERKNISFWSELHYLWYDFSLPGGISDVYLTEVRKESLSSIKFWLGQQGSQPQSGIINVKVDRNMWLAGRALWGAGSPPFHTDQIPSLTHAYNPNWLTVDQTLIGHYIEKSLSSFLQYD